METIQQERTLPINERLKLLEAKLREEEAKAGSKEKEWRVPFKWNFKFIQSKKVTNVDKILVMMFNKKNQIEPPKFMTIYGNIIVYKDKVYKYNPKAIWTLMVMGKPQIYCIKETDMEPISNLHFPNRYDIKSGRATQYHKLLLQAAVAANVKKDTKPVNWMIAAVIILVVVVGLIWFFAKG